MSRMLVATIVALVLAGCASRSRDGWDGMDGFGVAKAVKEVRGRPADK